MIEYDQPEDAEGIDEESEIPAIIAETKDLGHEVDANRVVVLADPHGSRHYVRRNNLDRFIRTRSAESWTVL